MLEISVVATCLSLHFFLSSVQWFLGALPSPPNQEQCTLASTARAQGPIRRGTALRWPTTRLEVPGRGCSPSAGRAGGPGTAIAMDMTGPGDAQASDLGARRPGG